jgi:hypothetical protein
MTLVNLTDYTTKKCFEEYGNYRSLRDEPVLVSLEPERRDCRSLEGLAPPGAIRYQNVTECGAVKSSH